MGVFRRIAGKIKGEKLVVSRFRENGALSD